MSRVEKITGIEALFDIDAFLERIHVQKESRRTQKILAIVEAARPHMRPVALYRCSELQIVDDAVFTVEGVPFNSQEILKVLKGYSQVYPNIVSCGIELENYCKARSNILEQYITMELCNYGCELARKAMFIHMTEAYGLEHKIEMFPGEQEWSLQQGIQIFKIFGEEAQACGLTISDRGIPTPSRTAYGFVLGDDNE
ncbi:MAG: hypothetical protein Q4C55_00815 [Eubacterium sp.]|nr:hypothetical protein [Eubacterium sp.]